MIDENEESENTREIPLDELKLMSIKNILKRTMEEYNPMMAWW